MTYLKIEDKREVKMGDDKDSENLYINKVIGNMGETAACEYLEKSGFEILLRNYVCKIGEIDIIAYKDYKIYFVEVKSVSRETQKEVIHETYGGDIPYDEVFYNPAEKADKYKIRKIARMAQTFLYENSLEEEAFQIDLITVIIYDGGFRYKIDRIENINIS